MQLFKALVVRLPVERKYPQHNQCYLFNLTGLRWEQGVGDAISDFL